MILHAIAIDDEPPALEVLKLFAQKVPFIRLQATFTKPTEALQYVLSHPVDLLFLDVQMPELTGTDFARLMSPSDRKIIFTTAHPQYAVEGFELRVIDFLLKPFDFPRFLRACNHAYQQVVGSKGQPASIFVKDSYDWVRVDLAQVLFIQSDSNLLMIHQVGGQRVSTRMTITEMMELLPASDFIRVHKSFIVAVKAITKIERNQLVVNASIVPLANSYREEVEKRLLGK